MKKESEIQLIAIMVIMMILWAFFSATPDEQRRALDQIIPDASLPTSAEVVR